MLQDHPQRRFNRGDRQVVQLNIGHSIVCNLIRRSAGRGLERRPQPYRGKPAG